MANLTTSLNRDQRRASDAIAWMVIPRASTKLLLRTMQRTGTWAEFVADLGTHEAGEKDGRAIVPYLADWSGGDEQPRKGAHELPGARWSLLTLDLDEESDDSLEQALVKLDDARISYVFHSTHSYDPDGLQKVRVHVPLGMELTQAEVAPAKVKLARWLGVKVDRATKGGHTLFYTPRCPAELLADAFLLVRSSGPLYMWMLDDVELPEAPEKGLDAAKQGGWTVAARPREEWPEGVVEAAQGELDWLCDSIRACSSGLRKLTVQATMKIGQYVTAGLLDEADALEDLEAAVRDQREAHGDNACSLQERYAQLREGLRDGREAGPCAPGGSTLLMRGKGPRVDHAAKLRAQLKAAVPETELTAAEVVELAAQQEPGTVIAPPPGSGKSRGALSRLARSDKKADVYAPNHRLLKEHECTLRGHGASEGDTWHVKAVEADVPGRPRCLRVLNEPGLAQHFKDRHINVKASVCPSCPHRPKSRGGDGTCDAVADGGDARINLMPHAAFTKRGRKEDGEETREIVFDEEPAPFERVLLEERHLADMASDELDDPAPLRFWSLVSQDLGRDLREAAQALNEGRPFSPELKNSVAGYGGRLHSSKHATRAHWAQWPWFADAAHALMCIVENYGTPGARLTRDEDGTLVLVRPTPAYQAILAVS